jgi:nicotinamide-nucleotide amidase
MNAIILSIGDELILGQTVDTNSAWLSAQLAAVGCDILAHATVPDDQPAIERAILSASEQCDFLVITGGIGPTADDLTRQALAAVLRQPLELNETWLAKLEDFFRTRRRPMPQSNRIQAMIPRDATIILNSNGTAAGIDATLGKCRVFVMPGVPKEMKPMFLSDILPHIRQSTGGAVILSRTLHTFGLGESAVAERLGDLMKRDRNPSVGTTVSGGVVSLRINARFGDSSTAQREISQTAEACREVLGNLIYGEDEKTLAEVIGQLLSEKSQSVATAESCTGGLLAKFITDVPGSSKYFQRGWITYSNEAKTELLGVDPSILEQHGAVSEPVVLAMATGARARAKSEFALSISGISGPDGGTPQKPVGTVCIALASPTDTTARTFNFPGDREWIRDRAAKMAMTMLRYQLLGAKLPF